MRGNDYSREPSTLRVVPLTTFSIGGNTWIVPTNKASVVEELNEEDEEDEDEEDVGRDKEDMTNIL